MYSVFSCSGGQDQELALTCIEESGDYQPPRKSRNHLACQACRSRKLKCSGEKGGCARCMANNVECIYVPQRSSHRRQLLSPESSSSTASLRRTSSIVESRTVTPERVAPKPDRNPASLPSRALPDTPATDDGLASHSRASYMLDSIEHLRPAEELEPPLDLPPPPLDPPGPVGVDLEGILLGLDSETMPFDTLCSNNDLKDRFSPTAFAHEMEGVDTGCIAVLDASISTSFSGTSPRDSLGQGHHCSPAASSSLPPTHCCSCVERSLGMLDKLFSCPRSQSVQREAVDHTLGVLNHFTSHAWTILDCSMCTQSRVSMTLLIALSEKTYAHFRQLAQSLARSIERLQSPPAVQQSPSESAHEGLSVMSFRVLLALKRFAAVEKQVARSLAESPTLYHLTLCSSIMDPGVAELLKLLKRAAEMD